MARISDALKHLCPRSSWRCHDETYASVEWLDPDVAQPTEAQVIAAQARLDCYARRRAAYPVRETFDRTEDWIAACDAVNAANPLPPE